ncbi:MAG: hypothetical protein GY835_11785 [bacterium]|nr:hypothetical protein [bacterium]
MARRYESGLRALIDFIQSLDASGELEPGRKEALMKAIKRMRHALRTGNRQHFERAVDDFARQFLRVESLMPS